jgi:hypothetical protein
MPIIQQTNPWASILGGLIGAGGNYIAAKDQAKKTEQDRQDKLKQQAIANAVSQGNLNINAANAGGSVDQKTGAFTQDPRISGMLAALAPQAPASAGSSLPAPGASPSQVPDLGGKYGAKPMGNTLPPSAIPPSLAGAATGAAIAATPQKPTPDQYNAQAQGELQAADKIEQQIRGFIGVPGPQAREVVSSLTQEANQHRERAQSLFQQAGRAKSEADADATKAQTAAEDKFGAGEMNLSGDPTKDLPILRKRLSIERGHGFRSLVGDTQKQIADDEKTIHQDKIDAENRAAQAANRGLASQRLTIAFDRLGAGQGGSDAYQATMRKINGMKPADAVRYIAQQPLSNADFNRAMAVVKGESALTPKVKPPPLSQQTQADFDQALKIYNAPNQTDENKQKIVNRFAVSHKLAPDKAQAYFDGG